MTGDKHQLAHRLEGYRSASVRNSVLLKNLACGPQFRCLLPLV